MSPARIPSADARGAPPARTVAVVGAGYFAHAHLQGWIDAGNPARALCDIDARRLAAAAQQHGIVHTYGDVCEMLACERPQLLDVVLPPPAQAAVVRLAIEQGIAVICQKPFGTDLAQARDMAARAAAAGVPLVVHENFRFTPWFREMRRLIDGGLLGRVHGVAVRLRPGDGQGAAAYLDRQPYFRTMPRLLIRETAVHYIDTFRYLMGEVSAVSARLRRLNPAIQGEDAALVIFEFADNATGLFDGNRLNDHVAADPRRTLGEMWLEGAHGVLRLDGDARLWWKPHAGDETAHPYDPGPRDRAFGGACAALQRHVLGHLCHGNALENAALDYLPNLIVQEAIYQSHAAGQRIEVARFQTAPEGDPS